MARIPEFPISDLRAHSALPWQEREATMEQRLLGQQKLEYQAGPKGWGYLWAQLYSGEAGCSWDIQPPLTDSFSMRGTVQPKRLLGFSDLSSCNGGKADPSGLLPGLATSCRGSEFKKP